MSLRHVRRLHVSADAEEDARHAATLLTDALHTASLPLADHGRLIVVRRLALGRISARVSPASLALRIERVTREVMSEAVTYDLPAAGQANAVVFPDRSEAIITLAGRYARAVPADEWFWSTVVRGWQANLSHGERWSLLLHEAHGVPGAAIVAAAVIDQAVGAGVEDRLLSSIPAGQGVQWLRLEGWSSLEPEPVAPPPQRLTRRRIDILDRWRRKWGPADDRLIWLGTVLTVQEHPACVAEPRLPAKVAGMLRTGLEHASACQSDPESRIGPARESVSTRNTAHADRLASPPNAVRVNALPELNETLAPGPFGRASAPYSATASAVESTPDGMSARECTSADQSAPLCHASSPASPIREPSVGDGPSAADATRPRPFDDRPDRARALESRVAQQPEPVEPPPLSGYFTSYAGLLFLVPILERLDFARFLAAHPAFLNDDFPARLLWFIGQRTGLKPDDPLALVLRCEPADPIDGFQVAHLPMPAREILSFPPARVALDSPFVAWLTAVRRWCRRYARQGLLTLIRRPGRVRISRTHVDSCFDLSQVDVRLRRLALDVDPGWVPWVGRVVQFNYLGHQ